MVAYRAETGLLSSWQERGPKLAWKIKGLGNGLSSIAVTEGCIYRIGKRDGAIKMIALNSKDGAKTWNQTSVLRQMKGQIAHLWLMDPACAV